MHTYMKPGYVLAISAAILIAFFASSIQPVSAKQPPHLKKSYAFTGTGTCLESVTGFTDDLASVGPFAGNTALAETVEGMVQLQSDGTGTYSGTIVSIAEPPAEPPSASAGSFSGTLTYEIASDGAIHVETSAPTTGTFTQGSRDGQTFSIDAIELDGHVGKNGDMITLATKDPMIETITYANGSDIERVCNRSYVAMEM
jgi:hypothetical protein